jgi:16S rRNA (guanine(966)-N(2))-methyltransferase RsmD
MRGCQGSGLGPGDASNLSTVRIIAGTCKGRRLKTPSWEGLRPTSDKLRETLFNILAPWIEGARLLDVFAGSGAVGLEALSRGAAKVVFIEPDRRAAALIHDNAALCGLQNRCAIIRDTAQRALREPIDGGRYDLVVMDPPYDFEPLGDVVALAAAQLADEGMLVLEHAARRPAPAAAGTRTRRTVRSGDSALTFYERLRDPLS